MLDDFVLRRLIPLGCVRAAIDDEDKLCIAREPRSRRLFRPQVASPTWPPLLMPRDEWSSNLTSA